LLCRIGGGDGHGVDEGELDARLGSDHGSLVDDEGRYRSIAQLDGRARRIVRHDAHAGDRHLPLPDNVELTLAGGQGKCRRAIEGFSILGHVEGERGGHRRRARHDGDDGARDDEANGEEGQDYERGERGGDGEPATGRIGRQQPLRGLRLRLGGALDHFGCRLRLRSGLAGPVGVRIGTPHGRGHGGLPGPVALVGRGRFCRDRRRLSRGDGDRRRWRGDNARARQWLGPHAETLGELEPQWIGRAQDNRQPLLVDGVFEGAELSRGQE
jgi:hypothetical protein